MKLMKSLKSLWRERDAVTAVEYGLIVAGVAAAIMTVLGTVGTDISAVLTKAVAQLK